MVSGQVAGDPFTTAERDARAMAGGGWWPATPQWQRTDLAADRLLSLPADGTCWLFGAGGRWYRWLPGDSRWQPCPPPLHPATRASARPLPEGTPVPPIPPQIVPGGSGHRPHVAGAFIGADLHPELTSRVRAAVESAAALPVADYPHRSDLFSANVPGTVAVTWGVMLWCTAAPVFDARLDPQLLGLWSPYRSVPLPPTDEPRWLTPHTLGTVLAPYAERLHAGRVDCAGVVLRTMWATAGALRADDRFRARADALLTLLDASLRNPVADYPALPHGDQALVRQWLARRPELEPVLRADASPGDRFREAYYDLAVAAGLLAGDPAEPGFVEPRHIAAALLATDLATVRRALAKPAIAWLDGEIREVVSALLDQPEHPLRRLRPEGDRLPHPLRERVHRAGPAARDVLLAAMYAADLAWCRLAGDIPARPRGFPAPLAILDAIRQPAVPIAGLPTLPPEPAAHETGSPHTAKPLLDRTAGLGSLSEAQPPPADRAVEATAGSPLPPDGAPPRMAEPPHDGTAELGLPGAATVESPQPLEEAPSRTAEPPPDGAAESGASSGAQSPSADRAAGAAAGSPQPLDGAPPLDGTAELGSPSGAQSPPADRAVEATAEAPPRTAEPPPDGTAEMAPPSGAQSPIADRAAGAAAGSPPPSGKGVEPPRVQGAPIVDDPGESTAPWTDGESPGPTLWAPPPEEPGEQTVAAPVEWLTGETPTPAPDPRTAAKEPAAANLDATLLGGTPTGTMPETPRHGTREMSEEMVDEVLKAAERRAPGDVGGFLRRLDDLVGLAGVKHTVRGLVAEARLAAERSEHGLPTGNPSRHLIFLGEPGTGKATVAGLLGGVYAALGLLDSGHLVACNADGLAGDPDAVAAHVGRAEGGLLLINDAHLLDDAPDGFAELLRLMRDRRDKFMLVCAGPPDEMNAFLVANPGFRAEFGAIAEFRPPSAGELVELFSRFAERELYVLDEDLRDQLVHRFRRMRGSAGFAYATTARRLFERMVERQAARLAGDRPDAAQATRLTVRDLPEA